MRDAKKNANSFASFLHTSGIRKIDKPMRKSCKPSGTPYLKTNTIGVQNPSRRKSASGGGGGKKRLHSGGKMKGVSVKKPHSLAHSVIMNQAGAK